MTTMIKKTGFEKVMVTCSQKGQDTSIKCVILFMFAAAE